MLRLFCAVGFIALGGYLGFRKRKSYLARVRQLSLCEQLLSSLRAFIKTEQLSTPEIFTRLSMMESLKELIFIEVAANRLKTEPNFPLVWNECINASIPLLDMKKEDYLPVLQLCELIGGRDAEGILTGLELSSALLKQIQEDALRECEQNGKLASSLGILGGVAAAILTI